MVIAAAACSSGGGEGPPTASAPAAPAPTAAPTTAVSLAGSSSTTAAPVATTTTDPFGVPDVIDETYVNRVLAELNRIYGDAVRLVYEAGEVTDEAMELVSSMSADFGEIVLITELSGTPENANLLREPPGDIVQTVEQLKSVSSDCVFAVVATDNAALVLNPFALEPSFLTLSRTTENLTGWALVDSAVEVDGGEPPDSCVE